MKKLFNMFAVIALCLIATFSLTAYGDDEPDSPKKEKTVKEAVLTTTFYVNQEVLNAMDIVGKSFLGQDLSFSSRPVDVNIGSQTIAMYPMVLEGTSNAVPFISIMNLSFTVKEGYKLPENNEFAISVVVDGTITYDDASQDTFASSGYSLHNNGVKEDKLSDYVESINKRFGRIKVTLESSGIEIDTSNE